MTTQFPNLARRREAFDDPTVYEPVDDVVAEELKAAKIEYVSFSHLRKYGNSEVPTSHLGAVYKWKFERAWRYWVASGPGVPPDRAMEFHDKWGQVVRVEGHCGCPSPLVWNKGFAVGSYHIDTQEGLNAFVELLKSIYRG